MQPLYLLIALMLLTLAMAIVQKFQCGREQCALRKLAVEHRMNYSRRDQLRLTARVAANLPIAGAAYVRVCDLIYASGEGNHQYIFTAEFTTGVTRARRRLRRVAAFSEPRQRSATPHCCTIQLAPNDLSLIEQYRALMDKITP
jgi:hypothetical protein